MSNHEQPWAVEQLYHLPDEHIWNDGPVWKVFEDSSGQPVVRAQYVSIAGALQCAKSLKGLLPNRLFRIHNLVTEEIIMADIL